MLEARSEPRGRVGQVVAERYELLGLVASGGQGHIYKARDKKDGELVAVKVAREQFAHDAAWRERLFREARALNVLTNTAAVRVYDQKWTDDGALCIVMELLEGESLEKKLRREERAGERVAVQDVFPLIDPIVSTLEVAHANRILHRDLKPDNIVVLNDGGIRLIDFGFAKFERLKGVTGFGEVAGSPTYLAPECWGGDSSKLTRQIDVYGLGAVIFRVLAGRPPFVGSPATLWKLATRAERPSLLQIRPDLPQALEEWTKTALAVEPKERFNGIRALWEAYQVAAGLRPS